MVHKQIQAQKGRFLGDTVDGWNLKQPPGMVLKPYKYWDKLPINWCRISAINSVKHPATHSKTLLMCPEAAPQTAFELIMYD